MKRHILCRHTFSMGTVCRKRQPPPTHTHIQPPLVPEPAQPPRCRSAAPFTLPQLTLSWNWTGCTCGFRTEHLMQVLPSGMRAVSAVGSKATQAETARLDSGKAFGRASERASARGALLRQWQITRASRQ